MSFLHVVMQNSSLSASASHQSQNRGSHPEIKHTKSHNKSSPQQCGTPSALFLESRVCLSEFWGVRYEGQGAVMSCVRPRWKAVAVCSSGAPPQGCWGKHSCSGPKWSRSLWFEPRWCGHTPGSFWGETEKITDMNNILYHVISLCDVKHFYETLIKAPNISWSRQTATHFESILSLSCCSRKDM